MTIRALVVLALLSACGLFGAGCSSSPPTRYREGVERWFGAERWRESAGLRATIEVEFRGRAVLSGRVAFDPDAARTRFDLEGGTVVVFDGERCWIAGGALARARFHALTWPYFVALPAKLGDPGSNLAAIGTTPWFGRDLRAARLTFDPGTGDAPDDWYVLASDPDSGALLGAAYVVTYGGRTSELEPHAVHYRDFQDVGGVRIATRATFYDWAEDRGPYGDPIGEYRVRDPELVDAFPDGTFARPDGAIEAPRPGGG